jgi:hypothetical protein
MIHRLVGIRHHDRRNDFLPLCRGLELDRLNLLLLYLFGNRRLRRSGAADDIFKIFYDLLYRQRYRCHAFFL